VKGGQTCPSAFGDDAYNPDWPERTWDIWTPGPEGHQVTTLAELRKVIRQPDAVLVTYFELPVARAIPEPLKSEPQALAKQPM
jgi:hypothetical protein